MNRLRGVCWQALVCLFLFILLSSTAHVQSPRYRRPTDRFGVAVNSKFGLITDYDVASLHIAWYSDWDSSLSPPRPGGIEYAQLLWVNDGVGPSLDQVGPIIDANPGSLWMIGNEPECIWQGNSTPEQYADVYHQLYTFIKGRDPTAQVAIGGVVQPTPLRLKWLDRVLDFYQATYGEPMPVDVWNIHNMILPEVRGSWGCEIPRGLSEDQGRVYTVDDNDNITRFIQHIVDFRTWMRDRGERGKPLIVSEFGVLMPAEHGFPPERVNAYMDATFDYLLSARDDELGYPADDNRMVQRWLWFSLNDQPWDPDAAAGFNGALFDYRYPQHPGVMTEMGLNFKSYTDALMLTPAPTPTDAAVACTIEGKVTLQRPNRPAPDASWSVSLTVTVGGTNYAVATDQWGNFELSGLSRGTYDITVKNSHTVSNIRRSYTLVSGINRINMGELREGDANGDDRVGLGDFLLLRQAYSRSAGQPGFVDGADFNEDSRVDSSDFLLLRRNYFGSGPIELRGAQANGQWMYRSGSLGSFRVLWKGLSFGGRPLAPLP